LGHLWIVELTYIKNFAFKFTVRYLQPDIVPIVCYLGGKFASGVVVTGGNSPPVSTTLVKLVAKFAAGVVDTGGKFAAGVVNTGGNFAAGVVDTGGKFATSVVDSCTRTCEYLCEF
jgi:hypothetical protein